MIAKQRLARATVAFKAPDSTWPAAACNLVPSMLSSNHADFVCALNIAEQTPAVRNNIGLAQQF